MTYKIDGDEIDFALEKAKNSLAGKIKILCDAKNAKISNTKD